MRLRLALLALGASGALASCNEQRIITGFEGDIVSPLVNIVKTKGDTMDVADGLQFSVSAADNLGLKNVSITLTGGYTGTIDTTFRTTVNSFTLPVNIRFPQNSTAGGRVNIRATATDGNNNSAFAIDSIVLTNKDALIVTLVRPLTGSITAPGKGLLIQVNAHQNKGITKIGWVAVGVVTGSDSMIYGPPLDTTSVGPLFQDTLLIPITVTSGTFTVVGFAEDASNRRVQTVATPVTIQTVATDNTPPVVSFTVAKRVEVRDSINVRAADPSGIVEIGWIAKDRATNAVVGGGLLGNPPLTGTLTDISQTFSLNFSGAAFATFPVDVLIEAYAVDAAGNRGSATIGTGATAPVKRDTVTVVNGITKPLPAGGRVGDAIYNRNLNEIYMTNPLLDRVEVYSVTDTAFKAFIAVGSKPWGIALWPRDTLGNNADTVVVANSGGTNLSIVDVVLRRERRRHALPNFLVENVHAVFDRNGNLSGFRLDDFDFSDRPEYLGMVCRPAGGTSCAVDSIYAVYSTTPTTSQAGFKLRGTMRWENLTSAAPESHFFWEHARPSALADSLFEYPDTIQIVVDGGGRPSPVVLIGASCFLSVVLDNLAFQDTTYVRNSGNFTHSLVGEGGNTGAASARVLNFDAAKGVQTTACPAFPSIGPPLVPASTMLRENGVSPGRHVSDFIANTAIGVRSVATNFNGRTNLVRADSIYVLDASLRLTGMMQSTGANAGMDLNFDHSFDAGIGGTPGTFTGTLNPNDRLAFAARPDATVDVFDTFFYGRIATIALRDPVTGPIRVAKLPTGEQILVGVTSRGVVTARLPAIVNTYLAPGLWGTPATH